MPVGSSTTKPRERIHVQLEKIQQNKTMSNKEKAMAILAIPQEDVIWTDNQYQLPFARRWAYNELNGNNKSLMDYISEHYHKFKQSSKGKQLADYLQNAKNQGYRFMSNLYKSVVGNDNQPQAKL